MPKISIAFPGTQRPSVQVEAGSALSEVLTTENSPILFGCRTGICGTCLIRVENLAEIHLEAPTSDESEVLQMIASDEPQARLACQINATCDLSISDWSES